MAYAYELISRPRAHLRVDLRQTRSGVSLLYRNRLLTRVYLNRSGMAAASAMAEALGVRPPAVGQGVEAPASTGLLYRVLALSNLDYRNPLSYEIADRLLGEAAAMRRSGSDL